MKKALFPAITTIITFVLFIGIYLFVTMRSIEPYYFWGLVFAVPFVCFGIITLFTVTGKLKTAASSVITGILIFVMGFAMIGAFFYISFDAATTVTTDIGKYERVLKVTGYPNNPLTKYFPGKIPGNARKIIFRYNPAFLQGSENFDLKFETDTDSINNYISKFSKEAKWTGKSSDSEAEKKVYFQVYLISSVILICRKTLQFTLLTASLIIQMIGTMVNCPSLPSAIKKVR